MRFEGPIAAGAVEGGEGEDAAPMTGLVVVGAATPVEVRGPIAAGAVEGGEGEDAAPMTTGLVVVGAATPVEDRGPHRSWSGGGRRG